MLKSLIFIECTAPATASVHPVHVGCTGIQIHMLDTMAILTTNRGKTELAVGFK